MQINLTVSESMEEAATSTEAGLCLKDPEAGKCSPQAAPNITWLAIATMTWEQGRRPQAFPTRPVWPLPR